MPEDQAQGSSKHERGRVTATQVARLAGVSQPTVSRAFNRPAMVSQATMRRVLAAANELNYEPDAIAQSLGTRQTNIVGIVMADITSPFYPYVLEKFTSRLQEQGRQVLLFNAAHGQNVDNVLPLALRYRVDAIIITSASLSSEMADVCVKRDTPVILFNRYVKGVNAYGVCCDNVAGGRRVADLLVSAGYRRLAYIAGREDTSTNIDRERGFGDRLCELGLAGWRREQGQYTYESGFHATMRLMAMDDPPEAIFCANDIMAMGAMDAARYELGIKVPEELAIVGFDDIPAASWPSYCLTTVRQPVNRMITVCLDLLDGSLESPDWEPTLHLIPGDVIRRNSARV